MNFFLSELFINSITGDLTEKPVEITGIVHGANNTRYTLIKSEGYKAFYSHASGARIVVTQAGSKYKALATLAKI